MEENSRDLNDILTEKDEPSDQIISSMTVNKSCLKEASETEPALDKETTSELVKVKEEPIDVDDITSEKEKTSVSKSGSENQPEPASQSDDCVLMEYRSSGVKGGGEANDADSEDSSSSSDDSSDESSDDKAADAKINKALSHERDTSPDGTRRIKLNRHGFEDIRTKGELLPEELPPLEELTITVDETVQMNCVGKIASIVGVLVVIQSESDIPPLNDDTILFVEGHKVLGQVFEVFGPVKSPWYSVRFNDAENIKSKELTVGMPVYCAPKEESFTRYVFVDSLKQVKGSDASWEDNNEPPDRYIEYSDDESERQAKAKKKNKRNTQESEKDEDNMEKKNKNEYNQQQRQKHYIERQHRGRGGNPRHTNPRGRGNPFQGQNQHTQRPRFASGQYNHPDNTRGFDARFNSPSWPPYRQNRSDNYNGNVYDNERYTPEQGSNFGGPPRFSSGPQRFSSGPQRFSSGPQRFSFDGNNPRPQLQQQNNQNFVSRNEQNSSPVNSNWNQFSQNCFPSGQGQRFALNQAPLSGQNNGSFDCPERLTSPPPPPPPPPNSGLFSKGQAMPVNNNQFTTQTGPPVFQTFPTNHMPPCVPSNPVQNQGPSLSPAPGQPIVSPNQFSQPNFPSNIGPQNSPAFLPVTPMMVSSPNANFACVQGQQGGPVVNASQVIGGQFNPNMPPPMANSSQNGSGNSASVSKANPLSQPNMFQPVNIGQTVPNNYPPTINASIGMPTMPPHSATLSGNRSQNTQSYGFQQLGNNFQNHMQSHLQPGENNSQAGQNVTFLPNQQNSTETKLPIPGNGNEQIMTGTCTFPQTGNQNIMDLNASRLNSAGSVAGSQHQNQVTTGHSGGTASQTLPFQDANFLTNRISAGLKQNNLTQITDRRLMQNE